MKIRSASGKDIRLSSTAGHIAIIGSEFKDIPTCLEADAIANGCITEGMYSKLREEFAGNIPDSSRPAIISGNISDMIATGDPADFTQGGLPDLRKLTARCGFTVSREAMVPVWETLKNNQS